MVHEDSFTASSVSGNGTQRITLTGDLDLASAPALRDELGRAGARFTRVIVLDLSALTFIDCAGLRAVFDFTDHVRARGWPMKVIGPPARIARTFTFFDSMSQGAAVATHYASAD
jgi:anti-anti-sigma factor